MTRPPKDWPTGLDDLAQALADTLHTPRPVRVTRGTAAAYHALMRDRVAHARDALLALSGDGPRPDLVKLAEWVYANAEEPPYKAIWDEEDEQ